MLVRAIRYWHGCLEGLYGSRLAWCRPDLCRAVTSMAVKGMCAAGSKVGRPSLDS